jgi:hypothetical protein
VTSEQRLAQLYRHVRDLGISCLVMGGHAVRFYGFERATVDYDLYAAAEADTWRNLPNLLCSRAPFEDTVEGTSWRPDAFRRFIVGALPSGVEERLELWRQNHLLPPFRDLWQRRVEGEYGGEKIAFLGIDDLIHSKETERDDDWTDIGRLEEIADRRRIADAVRDAEAAALALASIRSITGFEESRRRGLPSDSALLARAGTLVTHPVSQAFLIPALPVDPIFHALLNKSLREHLQRAAFASSRHLALVETVRRLYRRAAVEADRADKKRARGEP